MLGNLLFLCVYAWFGLLGTWVILWVCVIPVFPVPLLGSVGFGVFLWVWLIWCLDFGFCVGGFLLCCFWVSLWVFLIRVVCCMLVTFLCVGFDLRGGFVAFLSCGLYVRLISFRFGELSYYFDLIGFGVVWLVLWVCSILIGCVWYWIC